MSKSVEVLYRGVDEHIPLIKDLDEDKITRTKLRLSTDVRNPT